MLSSARMFCRLLTAAILLATPLRAEVIQTHFDMHLRGLNIARLTLADDTSYRDHAAYAIAGRLESTGLAGLFRDLRFDMQSIGDWRDGEIISQRYIEDVNTGRRASQVDMRWQDGIPVVEASTPGTAQEPWRLDPATQRGTIDPLSAVYALARTRPLGQLCDWSQDVFDGQRRSALSLGPATQSGDHTICQGAYRRVAGFSPEDMSERTEFPFTAHFTQGPDGWRLTQVDVQSLYGLVRITRVQP